ncbi:hypothetical protein SAMN04515674_110124 [Pseudarcicella hirudinis]|uniref:Long-chain fatty acid transport protein n=1 Tax=Pseudarcicella hirudinis TaxID=1079859 RepID=A0A1I5VXQ8_9BACT|nr:hypothetical protein [Pseudarcicella hirudinis]SFQ12193.1 hypothetical protein SAMN04515674_110124 [Pseudarcicella hirudinis]
MSKKNRFQVKVKFIVLALFTLQCTLLSIRTTAQVVNSPLSYLGLGELNDGSSITNQMMGGLGVANANGIYANLINPALLARNRYVVFEVGVNGEYKSMQNYRQKQNIFGGNYNSISLTLPLSSRWTGSLGLIPYSTVDYETRSIRRLNLIGTDSLIYTYKGSGGINKAFWSNGYRVGKEIYLGLEIGYLFGAVNRNITSQDLSDNQYYQVRLEDRTNYSDVSFKAGFVWRPKLKKDLFLNVAGTLDLTSNLKATRLKRYAIYGADGVTQINADTINNMTSGKVKAPRTARLGLSLERPSKWLVSADFSYTKWAAYTTLVDEPQVLKDSYKVAIGGEFTPDFNSISNYFKRVQYRIGASYAQTPYDFVNTGAVTKDMNITMGVSLPLRNLSYINVAYVFGKRGNLSDNKLEEQYHKFVIGFTLSDQWFQKVKIN